MNGLFKFLHSFFLKPKKKTMQDSTQLFYGSGRIYIMLQPQFNLIVLKQLSQPIPITDHKKHNSKLKQLYSVHSVQCTSIRKLFMKRETTNKIFGAVQYTVLYIGCPSQFLQLIIKMWEHQLQICLAIFFLTSNLPQLA